MKSEIIIRDSSATTDRVYYEPVYPMGSYLVFEHVSNLLYMYIT